MKFRLRDTIDAIQWTGENFDELKEFGKHSVRRSDQPLKIVVWTLNDRGVVVSAAIAELHDWVIRGKEGQFMLVKKDAFAATYEAVK